MIRVNLLPIQKARRRSAGRTQLAVFVLLVLLELAVFATVYMAESGRATDLSAEVAKNQQKVTKAKKEVKSATVLEKKQQELKRQVGILDELESKRTGPVRVLDELQALVSPARNEEERHQRARMNWNVEWDTRRLWVHSLSESDGSFEMVGSAVNADDVAEFLQRMTTAKHFQSVQLDYVKATETDKDTSLVEFRVTGQLRYSGASDDADTPDDGS